MTPQAVIDLLAGIEGGRDRAHDDRRRQPRAPGRHAGPDLAGRSGPRRSPPCWCCSCCGDRLPWAVNYPAERRRSGRRLGQRDHDLAEDQHDLAHPLDHRGARRAARFRARPARQELQDRPRRRRRSSLPRLSWVGVVRRGVPRRPRRRRLASSAPLVGGCFLYIALFGQWTSAMLTLGADLDRRAVLHRHRPAASASGRGASHGPRS